MDEDHAAVIDDEKCIQCGACVYQCPFGAIMDKTFITRVIDILKDSDFSKKYPVYAIVAPSVSSQFKYCSLGQVVTALHELGFAHVIEAALGADMVAYNEAKELAEKGFLTSSCCPTFVSLIKKYYPKLKDNISSNLSPMATIAKYIKEQHKDAKIVFIGPCVSKKKEIEDEKVKPYVDVVITFEELQAMIDARDIDASKLPEGQLYNASYYGRIFARCGGLEDAVKEALKEQGSTFDLKATNADGIDNCKLMLSKASNSDEFNFLEGMACSGGCIGGPCCLTHEFRDKSEVDKYGKQAKEKSIKESIDNLEKKA